MQGINLSTISNCYIGNQQVSSIYMGSTKIWPNIHPPHDYSRDYLTIEITDHASDFRFIGNDIQYSTDNGTTWVTLTDGTYSPQFNIGDKILVKANLTPTNNGIGQFLLQDDCYIYGNIMSLLYGDNFIGQYDLTGKDYAFISLFEDSYIVSAEHLILPATTLSMGCYQNMLNSCGLLTTAPELPATTLADYCYQGMFEWDDLLTTAPVLPATTLASNCYDIMFKNCSSLATAPVLPATTLADSCYFGMFGECTSLTTAPVLPATTLATDCYHGMFSGCTSLTTAPVLSITTLASGCYSDMFNGCTSLTTAPELPATTLVQYCYNSMFENCTSLNYIKCLAIDRSAQYCTQNWVYGVPETSGTFIKNANATWGYNDNEIPGTGWTVIDA